MINQIQSTLACFTIASLIILLTVFVFIKMTKYNDWEEIQKGNLAAALALGGKVFGVSNVMRFAIVAHTSPLDTVVWGTLGLAFLVLVYMAFEWLTPQIDVNKEIGSGNTAVGFMAMIFAASMSYIIGASIS
ncbi:DUF350 domain-containing protein [Sporomusa sp.]|uniref:DUF350 domain-containing protein n=1 Tax=Sporomusa sp. TaxID=2078658 RepID=UPI002BD5C96C|nr:DUF350 domain-containing protein [Sporomusa sp.]HWR44615.1 DUF350 domain-containing protein [Sporomusa sp.]